MSLWEIFQIAFVATMGFEVAIAICLTIGRIFKEIGKNGRN